MEKIYGLSESDRSTLKRLVEWWKRGGPGKSNRPVPTRRRVIGGDGTEARIILGQATEAGSASTFTIDNVIAYHGTDPTDGNPTTLVTVANPWNFEYENNDPIVAIENSDGNWLGILPGGPGGPGTVKLRLAADMLLADVAKNAQLVDDTGALVAGTVVAVDVNQIWQGYGPYDSVADASEDGFLFVGVKFTDDYAASGNPGYHVMWMERLVEDLEVQLDEDRQAGTTTCTFAAAFGTNGTRLPKRSAVGGKIEIGDDGNWATEALAGQSWRVSWDEDIGGYEFHHEPITLHLVRGQAASSYDENSATIIVDNLEIVHGRLPVDANGDPIGLSALDQITADNTYAKISLEDNEIVYLVHDHTAGSDESNQWTTLYKTSPSNFEWFIVVADIPAAAVSTSGVVPGTGTNAGNLLDGNYNVTGTGVDLLNFSETIIKASTTEPLAILGRKVSSSVFEIVNDKDFRGLPSYDRSQRQKIWHDAAGDIEWTEVCTHNFVTEVLIAGDKLQYKYHTYDNCTLVTVDIADIGPCD